MPYESLAGGRPLGVLIIEDDEDVTYALGSLLATRGHHAVHFAPTAAAAGWPSNGCRSTWRWST